MELSDVAVAKVTAYVPVVVVEPLSPLLPESPLEEPPEEDEP